MEPFQVLLLQALLSFLAYLAIGFWFVRPWLEGKPRNDALMILVLPHAFRHVGVSLLVPGLVDPGLPRSFAVGTATGDLLTVALAWLSLVVLRARWRYAVAVVWVMNLVGCTDLLLNLARGMRLQVAPYLGAAWYGPAFVVPAMLTAHILLFIVLVRAHPRSAD